MGSWKFTPADPAKALVYRLSRYGRRDIDQPVFARGPVQITGNGTQKSRRHRPSRGPRPRARAAPSTGPVRAFVTWLRSGTLPRTKGTATADLGTLSTEPVRMRSEQILRKKETPRRYGASQRLLGSLSSRRPLL